MAFVLRVHIVGLNAATYEQSQSFGSNHLQRTRRSTQSRNSALCSVVEFPKPQPTHSNSEERTMKIGFLALAATILYGFASFAAKTPTAGTIISEKSVECGTKNKGKKTIIVYSSVVSAIRRAHRNYRI